MQLESYFVTLKAVRCEPTGHEQRALSKNILHDNYAVITQNVLGEEAYQLQPGVCDHHLVLFILEGNRNRERERESDREQSATSKCDCRQIVKEIIPQGGRK